MLHAQPWSLTHTWYTWYTVKLKTFLKTRSVLKEIVFGILASKLIFNYSWNFTAMCHFVLFALEDEGTWNHKTSAVFGPELAHKQLASHEEKVSVGLFMNYSQHCGSLPRFSPKWLRGHMLRLTFSLTWISKWISYCTEDRSFHAFPLRAVNLISFLCYTALHCLVRMSPLDKTIQLDVTAELCIQSE